MLSRWPGEPIQPWTTAFPFEYPYATFSPTVLIPHRLRMGSRGWWKIRRCWAIFVAWATAKRWRHALLESAARCREVRWEFVALRAWLA